MATGRAGRAERLNERLRGAQRANVESDDLFDLAIPDLGQTQAARSSPLRQPPRSSPLKRGLDGNASRGADSPIAEQRQNITKEPPTKKRKGPGGTSAKQQTRGTPTSAGAGRRAPRTGPPARSPGKAVPPSSPARQRLSTAQMEEVTESPVNAPGSGRRRMLEGSALKSSSNKLQELMESNAERSSEPSSPLANKSRRSDAPSAKARRSSQMETIPEPPSDEDEEPLAKPPSVRKDRGPSAKTAPAEAPEPEEAEEIDAAQAAKTIGKRRPRESTGRPSPELGSPDEDSEMRAKPISRRQKRPAKSPAHQKQPAPRPKEQKRPAKSPAQQKQPVPKPAKAPKERSTGPARPPTSKQKAPSKRPRNQDDEAEGPDEPIEITVQRFINMKADGLAEIPHANRSGESVVDVFAQVCEEVIAHTLTQLAEQAEAASENKEKKAIRIKMRAIEAYREELSSRLLQHAIHLNHWHSVQKRVRHVQKEKLALRDEILRLRKEREQVALRIDAVRTKHEEDNNDATYRLEMSTLMQDIELAVERGRDAPEPSRAEKQEADLSNLEWAISHTADQASSQSATGGVLSQLKEFNAFLERAASALETK